MSPKEMLSRRDMVVGIGAASGALALGLAGAAAAAEPVLPKIATYRNAGCGCCGKWVEAARAAGFDVTLTNSPDLMALKARLGVPEKLISCHTSIVGSYVIEGHVPLDAVKRLLRTRPDIAGIAVPGMPLGTPGMEVPRGQEQKFDVLAFDSAGKIRVF